MRSPRRTSFRTLCTDIPSIAAASSVVTVNRKLPLAWLISFPVNLRFILPPFVKLVRSFVRFPCFPPHKVLSTLLVRCSPSQPCPKAVAN